MLNQLFNISFSLGNRFLAQVLPFAKKIVSTNEQKGSWCFGFIDKTYKAHLVEYRYNLGESSALHPLPLCDALDKRGKGVRKVLPCVTRCPASTLLFRFGSSSFSAPVPAG